ncbi:septation protein SpoVG family protein [Hydrogenoanaerobacterium sp.]|uniref:septation protein SpoVG family protein n=1 Tax=Hydrogenoanaerobacterium sp. TaxID=2953763 RepID=UPI00289E4432|nr:septation protein SpoVG family protein [Hydrogenoanaerobacterium sp.]
MPDVEVKINSMYPSGTSGGIRAYASATVDGCLGIRGIKVVEGGRDGLFVSMPSRRKPHRSSPSRPCRWAVCKQQVNLTIKNLEVKYHEKNDKQGNS